MLPTNLPEPLTEFERHCLERLKVISEILLDESIPNDELIEEIFKRYPREELIKDLEAIEKWKAEKGLED